MIKETCTLRFFLLAAVTIALMTLSGCEGGSGSPFESKDKGLAELETVERRWIDGVELASRTPRISLASQVSNLQGLRRDLQDVKVGSCLEEAKRELDEWMDRELNQYLSFLRDADYPAMDLSWRKDVYLAAKQKCAGGAAAPTK